MEHRLEVCQMFDETFKRKLIEEYLETGCCKMELNTMVPLGDFYSGFQSSGLSLIK